MCYAKDLAFLPGKRQPSDTLKQRNNKFVFLKEITIVLLVYGLARGSTRSSDTS